LPSSALLGRFATPITHRLALNIHPADESYRNPPQNATLFHTHRQSLFSPVLCAADILGEHFDRRKNIGLPDGERPALNKKSRMMRLIGVFCDGEWVFLREFAEFTGRDGGFVI
jgi:hypothetical protein